MCYVHTIKRNKQLQNVWIHLCSDSPPHLYLYMYFYRFILIFHFSVDRLERNSSLYCSIRFLITKLTLPIKKCLKHITPRFFYLFFITINFQVRVIRRKTGQFFRSTKIFVSINYISVQISGEFRSMPRGSAFLEILRFWKFLVVERK